MLLARPNWSRRRYPLRYPPKAPIRPAPRLEPLAVGAVSDLVSAGSAPPAPEQEAQEGLVGQATPPPHAPPVPHATAPAFAASPRLYGRLGLSTMRDRRRAFEGASKAPAPRPADGADSGGEVTRLRDEDFSAEAWGDALGEFRRAPAATIRRHEQEHAKWSVERYTAPNDRASVADEDYPAGGLGRVTAPAAGAVPEYGIARAVDIDAQTR